MRAAALAALLGALVLAVFGQTVGHDFVGYDDPIYVRDNPLLEEGPTPRAVWRAFAEPWEANWIPLTWVSLQVDHALYGLSPGGYHATNLILHLAATLLLFAALRRATGDLAPAAFVAAVFAIHPLHVESVAWIAERKDTLSGAFFALTLLLYARYVERPGAARYLAVVASTALGLLAKPMLVTLPCVLLLLDHWPFRRLGSRAAVRRALLEKLPLFALAALASAATVHAQRRYGTMEHGDLLPFALRAENAVVSTLLYLRDALWPSGLSVFHPHPQDTLAGLQVAAAALLLTALLALAALLWRRAPWVGVGLLWYLGMLVPVIGLVQVGMQGRADRYTYLPLVGATIALAWSVDRLAKSAAARRGAAAAGAAAVAALAVAAHAQAGVWRDTETLFRHATAVDPDNWFAWQWVGSELLRQRDLDAAEEAFLRSIELRPRLAATQRGLADVHAERGDWNAAIRGYERAIRLRPREAVSHMRLARALAASGQTAEALGRARHAVTLAKGADRAQALVILAFVHLERGEIRPAIAACRKAAEAQPGLAEAHSLRGLALLRAGRVDEARSAMQHALALASARGDSALAAEIRQQLEGLSG